MSTERCFEDEMLKAFDNSRLNTKYKECRKIEMKCSILVSHPQIDQVQSFFQMEQNVEEPAHIEKLLKNKTN